MGPFRGAVQEAGFDGTEVTSRSYLLHQFLSPVYNKRDVEYGVVRELDCVTAR